jgi:hypothetical protein
MKQVIKICILALGLHAILLHADANQSSDTKAQDSQTTVQNAEQKPTAKPKVDDNKNKVIAKNKPELDSKIAPFKTTLFVNGRVNSILLVITNDKNKQFKISIKAGTHYTCGHKPQTLKKVVCYEINAPNITLSQADLNAYAAFVFNTDQKTEKYNFISVQQKSLALKRARNNKNEALFHEIGEQSIYNP